jgi:hypothetical protein
MPLLRHTVQPRCYVVLCTLAAAVLGKAYLMVKAWNGIVLPFVTVASGSIVLQVQSRSFESAAVSSVVKCH